MSHSSRPPIAALGLPVAALAALAVLLAGASATAAPQVELRPVNSLERPIEQRIDALRRAASLPGVRHSQGLTEAAERHAATLARSGTFTHRAPGEKPFSLRLRASYPLGRSTHWATGENIFWAVSHASPDQVVAAWLKSPPHRANIYDPLWRDIGVAAVRAPRAPGVYGGRDVTIVVLELGLRRR